MVFCDSASGKPSRYRSQVVRQLSAKQLYAGANPAGTLNKKFIGLNCFTIIQAVPKPFNFYHNKRSKQGV